MKIKTNRIALLLCMVMMLSVVLAACVNTDNVEDIMDASIVDNNVSDTGDVSGDESIPTEEGHTEAPKVVKTVHLDIDTVAISGTCENGSTIRVEGGVEDVETVANGEYFIIQVDLARKQNLLYITAKVDGKEVSAVNEEVVNINATAEPLRNGNSVSVGTDSRLYFDKMADDASGKNLYSATQLNKIKDKVNATVNDYRALAGSQKVELIYLLIPNVTTVYPEILPESVVEEHYTTIYDQVLNTLNDTKATVVDMRETFKKLRDDKAVNETYGGLYRVTDSALTDYGAYLAYSSVMNVVSASFPNAAPKAVEDFDWVTKDAVGGNLVGYRELDKDVITEKLVVATPKFDMSLGLNGTGSSNIKSLREFVDEENGDYNYFTTLNNNDGVNGIAERWLISTERPELPSAIVYRDYSALSFSNLLAERFDRTLLVESGVHGLNLAAAGQYASEGSNVVDYIIVVVSEENMDTAFSDALA